MVVTTPYAKAFVGRWEDTPQKTCSFRLLLLLPLPSSMSCVLVWKRDIVLGGPWSALVPP